MINHMQQSASGSSGHSCAQHFNKQTCKSTHRDISGFSCCPSHCIIKQVIQLIFHSIFTWDHLYGLRKTSNKQTRCLAHWVTPQPCVLLLDLFLSPTHYSANWNITALKCGYPQRLCNKDGMENKIKCSKVTKLSIVSKNWKVMAVEQVTITSV